MAAGPCVPVSHVPRPPPAGSRPFSTGSLPRRLPASPPRRPPARGGGGPAGSPAAGTCPERSACRRRGRDSSDAGLELGGTSPESRRLRGRGVSQPGRASARGPHPPARGREAIPSRGPRRAGDPPRPLRAPSRACAPGKHGRELRKRRRGLRPGLRVNTRRPEACAAPGGNRGRMLCAPDVFLLDPSLPFLLRGNVCALRPLRGLRFSSVPPGCRAVVPSGCRF